MDTHFIDALDETVSQLQRRNDTARELDRFAAEIISDSRKPRSIPSLPADRDSA